MCSIESMIWSKQKRSIQIKEIKSISKINKVLIGTGYECLSTRPYVCLTTTIKQFKFDFSFYTILSCNTWYYITYTAMQRRTYGVVVVNVEKGGGGYNTRNIRKLLSQTHF